MHNSKLITLLFSIFLIIGLSSFSLKTELLPTKLKLTVLDGLGNPVEGATVTLYETEENYFNNEKSVAKGKTDEKGRVVFKDLKPIQYYIDARKGDMNNDGEGVKLAPLKEGRTNTVNTIIE